MELFWIKYEVAILSVFFVILIGLLIFVTWKLKRLVPERNELRKKFVKVSIADSHIEQNIAYLRVVLFFSLFFSLVVFKGLIERF